MPSSGYFDTPFGENGDLTPVPDATQGSGSVSYNQGYPIKYSTAVGSGGLDFPRPQHNQILNDITTAIQFNQQGNAAPFITSTMNGGSAYSYPKSAIVGLGGVNYISLVGSNTTTPPGTDWAVFWGGVTGNITVGHLAVFSDTTGTIEDGGAVPSAYSLPAATTSVLGGVRPDGTIITVSGGNITVEEASHTAFGVVKTDNTTIVASDGTISIPSSVPLPGSPTTSTQSPGDSSDKIATTEFANPASSLGTNGYSEFPSGLIIQWGIVAVADDQYNAVTFPTDFPNNIYASYACPIFGSAITGGHSIGAFTGNQTLSGMSVGFADTATAGITHCYWLAIGN